MLLKNAWWIFHHSFNGGADQPGQTDRQAFSRKDANDKRFKPVSFKKGLNVIIAERSENSSDKDTRNGAGKTTLINIIHFCFGGDLNKLGLPIAEIKEWIFYIELDLCGKRITARRSIENSRVISIVGDIMGLPIAPPIGKDSREWFYSNEDWKKLLGRCLFNLRELTKPKYSPSFRSLISYFVRRGIDAYSKPFLHFRNQKTFDWQINNAYLLGLNWRHASEAQDIRDQEHALKTLNDAVKTGIMASQGELEAERVRLEQKIATESKELKNFRVHFQYKELQDKVNQLTQAIHQISNQTIILQRKLSQYEESFVSEKAPSHSSVEKLYAEAGLYFADTIKKTLGEAKSFHESIVKNRKMFLQTEVTQIKNEISANKASLKKQSDERASIMQLLQSHGAFEEFSGLQSKITQERALLEKTKSKLADIKDMAEKKQAIKARKLELETLLQRDYESSRPHWENAISLFNKNSLALYDEPGNLIINTTDKGYEFDVEIQRSTSEGVSKMKIFCYDLMLVELTSQNNGIDFLIHDSTMYDGVDSRQRAHALCHASKKADELNFQYICALNSDMIPYEDFKEDFDLSTFVRLTLRDNDPSASLMGFHFELKKSKETDSD